MTHSQPRQTQGETHFRDLLSGLRLGRQWDTHLSADRPPSVTWGKTLKVLQQNNFHCSASSAPGPDPTLSIEKLHNPLRVNLPGPKSMLSSSYFPRDTLRLTHFLLPVWWGGVAAGQREQNESYLGLGRHHVKRCRAHKAGCGVGGMQTHCRPSGFLADHMKENTVTLKYKDQDWHVMIYNGLISLQIFVRLQISINFIEILCYRLKQRA